MVVQAGHDGPSPWPQPQQKQKELEKPSPPHALLNPKGLASAKVFLLLLVEAVSRNHEIMI